MASAGIEVSPVTPEVGAWVSGIDLSADLSDAQVAAVRRALLDHLVLFFADQNLDHDAHVAFSRRFGSLYVHPALRHPKTHPEIQYIHYPAGREPPPAELHTDATFLERPFMGCVLRSVDVPEVGGETIWASLYAAYQALSDPMKAFLQGLSAEHSPYRAFGPRGTLGSSKAAQAAENDIAVLGSAVHPLVRTHPETGRKALFVNRSFTVRINELGEDESRFLLGYLFDHLDRPEFALRHRWRNGMVAFWDNRCTVHRAVNNFQLQERLLFRTTIEGTKPYC